MSCWCFNSPIDDRTRPHLDTKGNREQSSLDLSTVTNCPSDLDETEATYERRKYDKKIKQLRNEMSQISMASSELLEQNYESSMAENQKLREEIKSLKSDLIQKDEVIAALEKKHSDEINGLRNEYDEKFNYQQGVNQNLQMNVSILMNQFNQLVLGYDG